MEDTALIGVYINQSDILKTDHFLRRPVVSVYLIDRKSGNLYSKPSGSSDQKNSSEVESVKSKCYDVVESRSLFPKWNELLILNETMSVLHSDEVLLMFELTDVIQQTKRKQCDEVRIAWAFLSPQGSDGSVNTNIEVRLQLYKPRKSCKISHQTCSLFHLYSKHELKKLHGSLFVTVKGVHHKSNGTGSVEVEQISQEEEETSNTVADSVAEVKPIMKIHQWSRLPSQSCKVPNQVFKKFNVGSNGASVAQFSRTGMYIAIASLSRILICDVISGEEVASLTGHNGLVYELDWSEDDKLLLSVSGDCASAIWSVNPLYTTPMFILPHPSFVYCGKWFGSKEQLVTGCKDHVIRYWAKINDHFDLVEEITGHPGFVTALTSKSNSLLFSGDSVGCIMIRKFSNNTWTLVKRLTLDEISQNAIDSIHFHLSQRRILISIRARGSYMIDTTAGVIIQSYKGMVNMCARSVSCLTPCGSLIFSFCQSGEVSVWEVNTGKLLAIYDNLFPIYRMTEASGFIHYHPYEHMIAFTVLGRNHPVLLLKYSDLKDNDDSRKIGLVYKQTEANPVSDVSDNVKTNMKGDEPLIPFSVDDKDKLASLVRNIDKVLTPIRKAQNDWSV